MKFAVIETVTLPLPLRKMFHTQKVSVMERDGSVLLLPISEEKNEGSGLLGSAVGSVFSTEIFLSYKAEDKELEK
jgi:hypothetical protein